MEYKKKYDMTRDENIFYAKRNIVDYIWKEANIEGIPITFPKTDDVVNRGAVEGVSIFAINVINNLKRAWEYILINIDREYSFSFITQVNKLIGSGYLIDRAGKLRASEVQMGGTKWTPDIPNMEKLLGQIKNTNYISNPIEKALVAFCDITRGQWFIDGNKRTAQIVANHILIQNGAGTLAIPAENEDKEIFFNLLTKFYETNNSEALKKYLYDNCIGGMNKIKSPD
jgi:prophage maintenance system killer protein